jgi:hypothetical protein
MTTENEPFEGDVLVTETYRELGVEKAPERLNQSILQMASGSGKKNFGQNFLFAAWMKPLAWTAMIGLCLAIVLELEEVPTEAVRPNIAPAAEMMLEEAALQNTAVIEKPDSNRPAISKDELGRVASTPEAVEVFSRQPKGKSDAVAAPAQSLPPIAPATRPATPEASSARKRAESIPADIKPMPSFLVSTEQKESDIAESCDEAVRLAEEDWLKCIENLRRSGEEEDADREYEAFILRYSPESHDLEENK